MTRIPQSITELTSEWLTATLREAGHIVHETVIVEHVRRIGEESGFASQVAQIQVNYDPPTPTLPSSFIAKMAMASNDVARTPMLEGKYAREAGFYSKVWPNAGCRTPFCYYVAYHPNESRFILLLEDLELARFGDAATGWSRQDATSVVDELASLHAKWWSDSRLEEWNWLPRFGGARTQLERFAQRRHTFLERFGNEISSDLRDLTLDIGESSEDVIQGLGGPPHTLLHVDTHLDNIAFTDAEGTATAILFDWQGVGKGLGSVDLSLFLLGGMTEPRRACENQLIERYHGRLLANGVTGYSLEMLNGDYARAVFRWWIGTVNGLGSSYATEWKGRQAEMARESVQRWNAINEDHDLARVARSGR